MKKIGTISSAIGLIFIGIIMILYNIDQTLSREVFKWWPAIFIVIGVEVLILQSKRLENTKIGFNPLIIFVVFLLICTNAYFGVKDIFSGRNFGFNLFNDMDYRYKSTKYTKTFKPAGNSITLKVNNGTVAVKKSQDSNVKIDGKLYTDKDESINGDSINISSDQSAIDLSGGNVNAASIEVYVPENITINIESDNIKFDSDSNISNDINLKASNGTANINGNIPNLKVGMDNGTLNVNNKLCKNVDIDMDNGTINFKTEDKNVDITTEIDSGVCKVNGISRVNAGISKVYGTGEGKISIKASHAVINVHSQE